MTTQFQPNLSKITRLFAARRCQKAAILFFSAVLLSSAGHAQSFLKPQREWAIGGACALWTGLNYTFQFTSPKIPNGRNWDFGRFDQAARQQLNPKAKTWSDITLCGSAIFSGLSIIGPDKNLFQRNLVIMSQSAWISANLAHSVKMIAKRNRPYTQSSGFQFSKRDDVYSFFSGHSCVVSSLFTSALLMHPFNGDSYKTQKFVLGAAGITAATTMILRIIAGKHYPTDILAGSLAGMGIAYLNFRIHEK